MWQFGDVRWLNIGCGMGQASDRKDEEWSDRKDEEWSDKKDEEWSDRKDEEWSDRKDVMETENILCHIKCEEDGRRIGW